MTEDNDIRKYLIAHLGTLKEKQRRHYNGQAAGRRVHRQASEGERMKYATQLIEVGTAAELDNLVEKIGIASDEGFAFKAVIHIPRVVKATTPGTVGQMTVFEEWLLYEREAPENVLPQVAASWTNGSWWLEGWIAFRCGRTVTSHAAALDLNPTVDQFHLMEDGFTYGLKHPDEPVSPKQAPPTNG